MQRVRTIDYLTMQKEIKSGQTAPLYVFYGNEAFLMEKMTDLIVGQTLSDEEKDFQFIVYDMRETSVETGVEEAETLPFFGSNKVVLLQHCYFLTGAREKEKVEHNLKALEAYCLNPAKETVLILSVPAEKLDERKKIVKTLKKEGKMLQAAAPDQRSMEKWVDAQFKQRHQTIEPAARTELLKRAGFNLNMLSNETDKVALYAAQGDTVHLSDIQALTPVTLEDNVFTLIDRVISQRTDEALRIYYDLLKQKEEPIKILALLARQTRMIIHVLYLKKQGYSRQKMAGQLKLHPYAVKIAEEQGRNYNEAILENSLKELAAADFDIKTGKMEKEMRLELSIITLSKHKHFSA
ncbi:DNA polymerase III subunit delta [Sinobaca sp. H24]|uniref:DNA polymerase III subunit delta n=1 Tax=Sinobaca sp. H24 TaxID=2923376 RepID=UPI00207AD509|nr:DNA polymerase III subunit delta [Sinobaca sp. H24]